MSTAEPPRSATPRAASRPAGPPPMTAMVSDMFPPLCCLPEPPPALADVVPGEVLLLAGLQTLEVLLELGPGRLPVDAHLFQQRPVIGRVPVQLAHLVGMGAHGQGGELRLRHD